MSRPTPWLWGGREEPDVARTRHGWRLFSTWLVASVAACLVIWFAWYPHMPPGRMSDSAKHQQMDIAVLAVTAAPVIIGVLLYFIYAIVVWRARPGDESDGPPIYGNIKVQAGVDRRDYHDRAVAVRIRHRRARRPGRGGGRRGPVADLEAGRNGAAAWAPGGRTCSRSR